MPHEWQERDLERFVSGDLTSLATLLMVSRLELLGTQIATVIVAPSFDKNVLTSVDHPILATPTADGGFLLTHVDFSSVDRTDLALEDVLLPYLQNLKHEGRRQEDRRRRLAQQDGRS